MGYYWFYRWNSIFFQRFVDYGETVELWNCVHFLAVEIDTVEGVVLGVL